MFPLYMGESLLRQRFSLIPLRGSKDSSEPKAPSIAWKQHPYQYDQRHARLGDVAQWLTAGWQIGIVTGRISGVIVLDFDTMDLWQRFSTELPHIVRDKLTVRTKRGIHLYIPVATSGAPIPKKKGNGWDLQTDGFYVVAPGSEINGHTYTILSGDLDQMPTPTPGQLKEILAWLDATLQQQQRPTAQPVLPGIERDRYELLQALRTRFSSKVDSSGGRNNALFESFTWGRDRGLSSADCMGILADFLHAPGEDQSEPARMKEFEKTLRSAFSRPARPVGAAPARLPDSARQALARRNEMHIWRLLDGLFAGGFRPGQLITRRIALEICGELLGERNVWRALSDARFFRRFEGKGSPAPTPNAYGVEPDRTESSKKNIDKCKYSRGKILQLNGHCNRGRPPHLYSIPTIEAVCRLLGITKPRWCTPIQHTSSKEARMALYYAKITHKPGTYANAALAAWFGVCPKTIKTYERELKIVRRPQYEETPVASWNTESLPEPRMGLWLQQHGERYPTVKELADKLLKKGRVSLVKQLPNHISTAEHLQQQKSAAIARMRAAQIEPQTIAAPLLDEPISTPTKAPQKPVQAPVMVQGHDDEQWRKWSDLFKPQKPDVWPLSEALPKDLVFDHALHADDAMRTLKRGWAMLQGVGISSTTTKSDRLELVQRVMPDASKLMSDHQYGYLLDKSPRRMLMWLRKKVGDPAYTRDDVKKLYRLMGGELTRKKAMAMFAEYGKAKTLRAAEFVTTKEGIHNKPAYLITCLRADKRMAALLGGR
jgi:hypothetical protein